MEKLRERFRTEELGIDGGAGETNSQDSFSYQAFYFSVGFGRHHVPSMVRYLGSSQALS